MTTVIEVEEKLYTVSEWLELEKHSEIRHEFYYGKLIPMSGEAKRANLIAGNIKSNIELPLREKFFIVYDHDVKAEVIKNGIYRYTDLVVAPDVDDEDEFIVKHPVMMVEVASKKSSNRDRVKKRNEYKEIPSLWYYLIADQDEMVVEFHSRDSEGQWRVHNFTEPSAQIELPKFGVQFTIADVYWWVKF